MADWYLAPALRVGQAEVDERWPDRDRTSDGTIGDEEHQARQSDHNPNERGSVNAWDMDRDGVDPWAVISAFQRHPSAHYWIFERTIADRDTGWRRRAYDGDNPHTQHVHFSIRQNAIAEQNRTHWGLIERDAMNDLQDKRLHAVDGRMASTVAGQDTTKTAWSDVNPTGTEQNWLVRELKIQTAALRTLAAAVATLIPGVEAALADDLAALVKSVASVPGQVVAELREDPVEAALALIEVLGATDARTLANAILTHTAGSTPAP